MCWHTFCSTSVEPQTNLFLSHSRPLLKGSPALIPTPIPMRKKRDAKINSQRRILLLMLPKDCNQMPDCRPCIQAWAEALSTLKRLLRSTQQAWSSASHDSSCHFKCSPIVLSAIDPAHSLRPQIWWSSEYMCFKSCASDKPGKAKLFWIHRSKKRKRQWKGTPIRICYSFQTVKMRFLKKLHAQVHWIPFPALVPKFRIQSHFQFLSLTCCLLILQKSSGSLYLLPSFTSTPPFLYCCSSKFYTLHSWAFTESI